MTRKYYLTQYALTKGIIEVEIESIEDPEGFFYLEKNSCILRSGFIGIDLFKTYEEACVNAEQRKRKAIDSLKSRIKKLKNKHFVDSSKKEQ